MRVLIVGAGAIGTALAHEAKALGHDVWVTDVVPERAAALARAVGGKHTVDARSSLGQVHLVVEAATQDAVREWAPAALASGADVLVMSVGALVDDAFVAELSAAATRTGRRLYVPSGAIAGLDAVKALAREPDARCTLTTRKPPAGLGVAVDKPTTLFEGDYRSAVAKFPKNVNVAAALALAGLAPTVRIVVDPGVTRNTHEVLVETPHHRVRVTVESDPSGTNPATSDLALRSAQATLRRLDERIRVGT